MINRRPRRLILPGACTFVGVYFSRNPVLHPGPVCQSAGTSVGLHSVSLYLQKANFESTMRD